MVANENKNMGALAELRKIFEKDGVLSVADPKCRSFSRYDFSRLVEEGFLIRVSRGVYAHAGDRTRETMDYEGIAATRPDAVLCLFSALRVHGLTDENPSRIHVAIPQGGRFPKSIRNVQLYRFSPSSWSWGIEERRGGYVPFKVYSVEKTIADCFKFRSVVGLDVAVAAFKDAHAKGLLDWDRLWKAMEVCRMTRVMRPYMESIGCVSRLSPTKIEPSESPESLMAAIERIKAFFAPVLGIPLAEPETGRSHPKTVGL